MTKKSLLEQFKDYLAYERGYSNLTLTAYINDLKQAEDFWKNNGGFNGFEQVSSRDVEIFITSSLVPAYHKPVKHENCRL